MVDVKAIYRFARKRIRDPELAADVAQTACLYALIHRPTSAALYVFDAIDHELGKGGASRRIRTATSIQHQIASLYPTEAELLERWHDEESEDQADEWRSLPPADRDQRVAEATRALGSSDASAACAKRRRRQPGTSRSSV